MQSMVLVLVFAQKNLPRCLWSCSVPMAQSGFELSCSVSRCSEVQTFWSIIYWIGLNIDPWTIITLTKKRKIVYNIRDMIRAWGSEKPNSESTKVPLSSILHKPHHRSMINDQWSYSQSWNMISTLKVYSSYTLNGLVTDATSFNCQKYYATRLNFGSKTWPNNTLVISQQFLTHIVFDTFQIT